MTPVLFLNLLLNLEQCVLFGYSGYQTSMYGYFSCQKVRLIKLTGVCGSWFGRCYQLASGLTIKVLTATFRLVTRAFPYTIIAV